MNFVKTPLGPIGANCYFLTDQESLCLIDPGDEEQKVISEVKKSGKNLELIILTHGHYDHTGAVKALKEEFPQVLIYIHEGDAQGAGSQLCPLAGEVSDLHYLEDGQILTFGSTEIKVLVTQGHSLGSVCFQVENELFTGDTLFEGSMGRVDFPGGSYETIMKSLKRLSQLPPQLNVHPGHGDSSTIERECKTNPYMQEAIRHTV